MIWWGFAGCQLLSGARVLISGLAPTSSHLVGQPKHEVLIDGKQLGLGVLLERKGVESERSEVEEGTAGFSVALGAVDLSKPDAANT